MHDQVVLDCEYRIGLEVRVIIGVELGDNCVILRVCNLDNVLSVSMANGTIYIWGHIVPSNEYAPVSSVTDPSAATTATTVRPSAANMPWASDNTADNAHWHPFGTCPAGCLGPDSPGLGNHIYRWTTPARCR